MGRRPAAHRFLLFLGVWGAFVSFLAKPAFGTVENFSAFKQTYPGKPVSCKTCHENPIGRKDDLNLYGKTLFGLKAPANPKKLKMEDFRSLESADSDGDGVSNGEEIQQGTPPGVKAGKTALLWGDAVAWAEEATVRAEYVGGETCAACHAKETKEFKRSTHARISIPKDVPAQSCEMCHGPGSLHAAAGGRGTPAPRHFLGSGDGAASVSGKGVGGIINPRKDPSACFACHLDKKAEFRLPFHHPVMEGKMSCADCHSAHGEEIRPWTSTSMEGVNEACFKCHKEQRGPFAWEHEALREGCTTCHKVHGSIHDKMLVARDNNLCLRCHTQVNFPTIGKQAHGGRLPQGTCFSAGCHTAVHGSNFDDHLRY